MRAILLSLISLFFAAGVAAQNFPISGYCEKGASNATTQGLNSTNTLQGVVPGGLNGCLITVYLTGTTTPALIYSNAAGTVLANPFRANVSGQFIFYAAAGQQYDVIGSGGIPPNNYASPVTLLTGVFAGGGSGGGGAPSPPAYSVQIANPTGTVFASDPNITINTTLHSFNVGTTQFIDSGTFGSFAAACTAASSANVSLLCTKAWPNIPTGTYSCNINVPAGPAGAACDLQVATNARMTWTGQYSGPISQWIDVTTNSGASLDWNSPSYFYPDYLGATGNGSSNDGPYLQAWVNTLLTSGLPYENPTGHLVQGENYLSNQLINATCPDNGLERLKILGDGNGAAIIIAATTGSPGIGFDTGGCNNLDIRGVNFTVPSNNPANSPMETAVLSPNNGKWNSGYNTEAGGGFFFDHDSFCGGYNSADSNGTATAVLPVIGADNGVIQNSTIGCAGGGGYGGGDGSAIVFGVVLGPASAVVSSNYTFNPSPGFPTHLTLANDYVFYDYGYGVAFTGGGLIGWKDGYLVSVDQGLVNGSQFVWTAFGGGYVGNGSINATGVNTENQSVNGQNFAEFDSSMNAGQSVDISGRLNASGAMIYMPHSYTNATKLHIYNMGDFGSIFNFHDNTDSLQASVLQPGYGVPAGTINGASFGSVDIIDPGIACNTMAAALSTLNSTGNWGIGTNGCPWISNVNFASGLTLNGNGLSNGMTQLGITPNLLTWNQPFNLNAIVSGNFSNLAPWSNNFSGGTSTDGWTNGGFVITPGQPDPWGGTTATILSCATFCSLSDVYTATPLTASTSYQSCLYGSLTSGTNSLYLRNGASAESGGAVLQSYGWGPVCLNNNTGAFGGLSQILEIIVPNGPTTVTLYGVSVALASTPTSGYQYTAGTPQSTSAPGTNIMVQGEPISPSSIVDTGITPSTSPICPNGTGGAFTTSGCAGGGGSMTWPSGGAGIPNYTGSSAWGTSYSASNTIPANFVATLNQSTTGNAATATNLASYPATCTGSQFSQGLSSGSNNCATPSGGGNVGNSGTPTIGQYAVWTNSTQIQGQNGVPYSALTGSPPTFNQSTTGNAATATALASAPSSCVANGQFAQGVLASGAAICDANLDDGHTTANTLTYTGLGGIAASSFTGTGPGPSSILLGPVLYSVMAAAFTCNSGNAGRVVVISDYASASSPTWNAVVSSGTGTATTPITTLICDGAGNWRVH